MSKDIIDMTPKPICIAPTEPETIDPTIRFAIVSGLACRAHLTGMRAGPAADMVAEDIIKELFSPALVWALKAKLKVADVTLRPILHVMQGGATFCGLNPTSREGWPGDQHRWVRLEDWPRYLRARARYLDAEDAPDFPLELCEACSEGAKAALTPAANKRLRAPRKRGKNGGS